MAKKLTGIYAIAHKQSGKTYVGQAQSIRSRWTAHKKQLNANKHHTKELQILWNSCGEGAFSFGVLREAPEELSELDLQRWLVKHERAEYDRLRELGLLLNSTLPAIKSTKIAQEQYAKERKTKEREHDKSITATRKEIRQKMQEIHRRVSPLNAQYSDYLRELKALEALAKKYSGFWAKLTGTSQHFDHDMNRRRMEDIKAKITTVEPTVREGLAEIAALEAQIRQLYGTFTKVRKRRISRIASWTGIDLREPTIK